MEESARNNNNTPRHNRPPKQPKVRNTDHTFKKRKPPKPEEGPNIIYVSTKTHIKAVLEKCAKLIEKRENEIVLYCLGAAIQRGILLAITVTKEYVAFQADINTFTTELTDDLEPALDDADYAIQRRNNSALKIRLIRSNPLEGK